MKLMNKIKELAQSDKADEAAKILIVLFFVSISFFAMISYGVSELNAKRAKAFFALQEELTKEINMATVPIEGTKNFTATVRIKYVDGNLKEVVLVPRTTIEEK